MSIEETSTKDMIQKRIEEIYSEIVEDKEIEVIEKKNFFRTSIGDEFHHEFLELFSFVSLITSIKSIITWAMNIRKKLVSPSSIPNVYQKLLEESTLDEDKKNEAQTILTRIEKEWVEFHKKLEPDISELQTVLSQQQENQNEEKQLDENSDFQQKQNEQVLWLFEQIPIRVFSYFVTTLYALIDVYTMSLIQMIISFLKTEQVYEFFKIRISDLKENIKYILEFLKMEGNQKLLKVTENTTVTSEWKKDLNYVAHFISLRHIFAHKNPLLEMSEMMDMDIFDQYKKKLEKEAREFKTELEKSDIQISLLKSLFEKFSDILPYMVFIKGLGFACYRYLCVVDNIIQGYFDFEKFDLEDFLLSIKDQMKNEEDAAVLQKLIDQYHE